MQVNIQAWLIFTAGSALFCCLLLFISCAISKAVSLRKSAAFSLLSLLFGILFGFLSAKLLYMLLRWSVQLKEGFFSVNPLEMSYYGGFAGICLGIILAAKCTQLPILKALNHFAFAGAVFAALLRFAEYWLGYVGTGGLENVFAGDIEGILLPFPFAMTEVFSEDYAECYLAIFMLECFLSLRVAVFALQKRKDSFRFFRTLFYLCLFQILCESMRDISLRWLFVRYEQLICYLVAEAILVWYGILSAKEKKWNFSAAIIGLIVCGLTIAEEFMMDGKVFADWGLPRVAVYIFMALGLAEMMIAEHSARKKSQINVSPFNPSGKP